MPVKPRSPEEIADKSETKSKYTLYLSDEPMEEIKTRAAKAEISASLLVDEAIKFYLEHIRKR